MNYARALAAALAVGGLPACSYTYEDDAGARHVMGLVNLTIAPPESPRTHAGRVFDLRTVGLAVSSSPDGTSVTLGYHRERSARIRDHALVVGNPLALGEPSKGEVEE